MQEHCEGSLHCNESHREQRASYRKDKMAFSIYQVTTHQSAPGAGTKRHLATGEEMLSQVLALIMEKGKKDVVATRNTGLPFARAY